MTLVNLSVDTTTVFNSIDEYKRQYPYAVSVALNSLATKAVEDMREGVKQRFHIRRPWTLQGIKIMNRATKAILVVTIGIDSKRSFLEIAELGTSSRSPLHSQYQWVPNPQAFNYKVITASNPLHPNNLQFVNGRGPLNTAYIKNVGGNPLVVQRVENKTALGRSRRGKSQIGRDSGTGNRVLFFLHKTTKVPMKLRFIDTITRSVNSNWNTVMNNAINKAMASAR